MSSDRLECFAQGTSRAKGEKDIEADDCGRKDDGQGDDGLDENAAAPVRSKVRRESVT